MTDTQMVKLDLRLRPGQRQGALKHSRVTVLVCQIQDLLAGGSDDRGKHNARGGAWRDAHRAPQAHHRVEDGTDGIREWPAVDHRDGIADVVPASEEPRAVRLELQVAHGCAFHHDHVCGPHRRVLIGLPAARRQQRADLGGEFRLHKQVGKRRVCHIGGLRSQGQLGIRRDLNVARACPQIGEGDAPHFSIVLGRHDDLERGGQGAIAPDNLGMVFAEGGLVRIGFDAAGLIARRPDLAGLRIAKKDVRAPAVPRGILAPARDRNIPPAAVP